MREAVAADRDGDVEGAIEKYRLALPRFKLHLNYEKNPNLRETVSSKVGHFLKIHYQSN